MSQIDLVKKLIKAIDQTDITKVKYEEEGIKIELSRGQQQQVITQAVAPAPQVAAAAPAPAPAAAAPAKAAASEEKKSSEEYDGNYVPVTSPFVGTFYRSPAPGAPAFIQEGQEIHPGHVICIVEAMKLMNEIEAERHARIAKILVENGAPVEFGQEMVLLEILS